LSRAFQNATWLVRTSQSLHILAVGVLFASASITFDLARAVFFGRWVGWTA